VEGDEEEINVAAIGIDCITKISLDEGGEEEDWYEPQTRYPGSDITTFTLAVVSVTEITSRLKNEGGGESSLNSKYNIDNWPRKSIEGSAQEILEENVDRSSGSNSQ
jgi:hypothetical protein